jgi:hypothetical protein
MTTNDRYPRVSSDRRSTTASPMTTVWIVLAVLLGVGVLADIIQAVLWSYTPWVVYLSPLWWVMWLMA